jgi:hypothetical protein
MILGISQRGWLVWSGSNTAVLVRYVCAKLLRICSTPPKGQNENPRRRSHVSGAATRTSHNPSVNLGRPCALARAMAS